MNPQFYPVGVTNHARERICERYPDGENVNADNLALAISSIKDSVDPSILEGLQAIENNFTNALRKNGIEKIETIGKPLNPMEHRVVTQIESDAEENSIVQEFQAGYKIGDKVIREAMVATAKPKQ